MCVCVCCRICRLCMYSYFCVYVCASLSICISAIINTPLLTTLLAPSASERVMTGEKNLYRIIYISRHLCVDMVNMLHNELSHTPSVCRRLAIYFSECHVFPDSFSWFAYDCQRQNPGVSLTKII